MYKNIAFTKKYEKLSSKKRLVMSIVCTRVVHFPTKGIDKITKCIPWEGKDSK